MFGDGLAPGLLPAIDDPDIHVAPSYIHCSNLLVADSVCVCRYPLQVGLNFDGAYIGRLAAIATRLRILRRKHCAQDCEKGRTCKEITPHSIHPLPGVGQRGSQSWLAAGFWSFYIFQSKLALPGNLWGQAFWPAAALPGGVAVDRGKLLRRSRQIPHRVQCAGGAPHTRISGVTGKNLCWTATPPERAAAGQK